MNKKVLISCFLLYVAFLDSYIASCQDNQLQVRPLTIGDKVPNLIFNQVLNHNSKTAKLSDFKGKLIILDFWNVHCPICIALFPKLEKIQEQMGESLVILPIGFDGFKEGEINSYYNNRKSLGKEIKLPIAVQSRKDTLLRSLFPFLGFPHVIWINERGVVIGITGHSALTSENIKSVLNRESIAFKVRKKPHLLNSTDSFLLMQSKTNTNNLVYGSAFSGYCDTLVRTGESFRHQFSNTYWRFFDVNQTVFTYYKNLYRDFIEELDPLPSGNKRILIESGKYKFYDDWDSIAGRDNWAEDTFNLENLFSYETILPIKYTWKEVRDHMIRDFDKFFAVSSKIEIRKIKCLVLVRKGKGFEQIKSRGDVTETSISINASTLVLRNRSMTELTDQMNYLIPSLLVLNETGYDGKISVDFNISNVNDLDVWSRALFPLGLDLIEAERELPMLVLRDLRN